MLAFALALLFKIVMTASIVVTTASYSIVSFASGLFAFFPVAMSSFFVILHTRLGGATAGSTAAHVPAPMIGLGLGLLAVHFMAVPFGVWWSYLVGLCIGLAWNGALWVM